MMIRAQQPFYISSYGIVKCNLSNFIGVSELVENNFQYKIVNNSIIIAILSFPGDAINIFRFHAAPKNEIISADQFI